MLVVFLLGLLCGFLPAYLLYRKHRRKTRHDVDRLWTESGELRVLAEACAQTLQIERWEQQMADFMEGER